MINESIVNDILLKTHANEPYIEKNKEVTESQNTIVVHVQKESIFQKIKKFFKRGK